VKTFLKILSAVAVLAFVAMLAFLIVRTQPARREATFFPMGGIPFKVVAYGRTEEGFADDMAAVEARVAELEEKFDRHEDGSELMRLNEAAAAGPVAASRDMRRMVALSREWHEASGGAFDPSIMPLIAVWKEAGKSGILPDAEVLDVARGRVDFDMVELTDDSVGFAKEGMSLDFGAIAKGLMIDEVANLLMGEGGGSRRDRRGRKRPGVRRRFVQVRDPGPDEGAGQAHGGDRRHHGRRRDVRQL